MPGKYALGLLATVVLTACASKPLYETQDIHFILPCKADTAACMARMESACAQAKGQVQSRNITQEEVPVVQVICRPPAKPKTEDDAE